MRRLTMYTLRAAVDIAAGPEDGVTVFWGDDSVNGAVKDAAFAE